MKSMVKRLIRARCFKRVEASVVLVRGLVCHVVTPQQHQVQL